MTRASGFVEAMLAAPLGVALLGRIEARADASRGDGPMPHLTATTDARVRAAMRYVEEMTFGELLGLTLESSVWDVGPWMPRAPVTAAAAYRGAAARIPIAEAIDRRFGGMLHSALDRPSQEWWTVDHRRDDHLVPVGRHVEQVSFGGQYTRSGLWSVTGLPASAHFELAAAWEMDSLGPITRWALPVHPEARVFEINRPSDWTRLVTSHRRRAESAPSYWELPSVNRHPEDIADLLRVRGQRAARRDIRSLFVPDWRSVAEEFDGVHLTWAGFITTEGCITDLGDGDVTLMRCWISERTHWLSDVFGDAEPLAPPQIPDHLASDSGLPGGGARESRLARDRRALDRMLGRVAEHS